MLATGGTIMTAMAELQKRGVDPALTRIISVVAAPQLYKKLSAAYPGLIIYTATIDEAVNSKDLSCLAWGCMIARLALFSPLD